MAQSEPPAEVDEILAEGWHLYSEELDFEQSAEVYSRVPEYPEATEGQLLEAFEYLAACRYALGDEEGARVALNQLLAINPEQHLNDPSHPPELLELLEQVRTELPEPEPELPVPSMEPEPPIGETPLQGIVDEPPSGRRPWYRTWWFWTVTGVVVAGAVTTALVLTLPGEAEPPPQGSLAPGVVQLPCAGIPF